MRLVRVVVLVSLCFLTGFYFLRHKPKSQVVYITQIAPHPSLDKIRQGIEEVLKTNPNLKIQFQNAQGSMSLAAQIAQKAVSEKPSVIVPITTPSAQAVVNLAPQESIPVVFAAITDPIGAKIISSYEKPIAYVTGVSDFPPLEKQVELIQNFFAQKAIKLGVLYNPSESNSLAIIEELKKQCLKRKITLEIRTVTNTTDILSAVNSLIPHINALYIPNDNTVVTALPAVLKAVDLKFPVFASDPESVEKGCVAALAFDQKEMGRQTGTLVLEVLRHPRTLKPVQKVSKPHLFIHAKTLKHFGFTLPVSFKPTVIF